MVKLPSIFQLNHLRLSLSMENEQFSRTVDSQEIFGRAESLRPDAIFLHEYRELVREQVDQLPATLFQDLTGLQFQVFWVPIRPSPWNNPELAAQPLMIPGSLAAAAGATEPCWNCFANHFAVSLKTEAESHCSNCPLDVSKCWFPIVVRELVVGFASIRTLETVTGPHRTPPENMARPAERVRALGAGFPSATGMEPSPASLTQSDHAMSLLRLIVHHVETAAQVELSRIELDKARQRTIAHERKKTLSRANLSRMLPSVQPNASTAGPESRAEQLVHRMLDFIRQNLSRPITLQDCADELRLNPVYLCTLFARVVGVPFKAYLIRLRIEKAKELLSDPVWRVSDVAFAVGYTDEDYFRRAFKAATGLSPAAWRGALQAQTKSKESPG